MKSAPMRPLVVFDSNAVNATRPVVEYNVARFFARRRQNSGPVAPHGVSLYPARGWAIAGILAYCRPCLGNNQGPQLPPLKPQRELVWVRDVFHLTTLGVLVVHQNENLMVSVGEDDLIIPQSLPHHVLLQHSGPRTGVLQHSGAKRQGCNGRVVGGARLAGVRGRAKGCGVRGAPTRGPRTHCSRARQGKRRWIVCELQVPRVRVEVPIFQPLGFVELLDSAKACAPPL